MRTMATAMGDMHTEGMADAIRVPCRLVDG